MVDNVLLHSGRMAARLRPDVNRLMHAAGINTVLYVMSHLASTFEGIKRFSEPFPD